MNSKLRFLGVVGTFCAALGAFSGSAAASITPAGKIESIRITNTNTVVIVLVNVAAFGRAACHNAGAGWSKAYTADLSTNKGKALLSTAQAAKLADRDVYVEGATTCMPVGSVNVESIQTMDF